MAQFLEQPNKAYLVSGAATADKPLLAFDRALRSAGIADLNLIQVTSIFPPGCRLLRKAPKLYPGALAPTVYNKYFTKDKPGGACIAVAKPKIPYVCGVFFEHSGNYETWDKLVEYTCQMAYDAMRDRNNDPTNFEIEFIYSFIDNPVPFSCAVCAAVLT